MTMKLSTELPEKGTPLEKMIAIATIAHEGQKDKGGQPYILHPMRVMLSMPSTDEKGRIVGMGHDLVEDTGVVVNQVRDEFGNEIADAINALTRIECVVCGNKQEHNMSAHPVREQYMQFIGRIAQNEIACRVKLMDIADNTRPERYHPSIVGLQGRYEKAKAFLTAALLEYNSRDTLEFLCHTGMINIDEMVRRLRIVAPERFK